MYAALPLRGPTASLNKITWSTKIRVGRGSVSTSKGLITGPPTVQQKRNLGRVGGDLSVQTASNGTVDNELRSHDDEASFFIRNLRALPWQRAAVWLVCGMVGWQLADFFGVRFSPRLKLILNSYL